MPRTLRRTRRFATAVERAQVRALFKAARRGPEALRGLNLSRAQGRVDELAVEHGLRPARGHYAVDLETGEFLSETGGFLR